MNLIVKQIEKKICFKFQIVPMAVVQNESTNILKDGIGKLQFLITNINVYPDYPLHL